MTADQLLRRAYELGASDIHITVQSPPLLRIYGQLHPYGSDRLSRDQTADIARQLLSEPQFETLMAQGDLDATYGLPGVSRYRINAFKQRGSVSLTIRLIPQHIPALSELGLPSGLPSLLDKPQGLLLVTGPTGSGKSTTLAAMIDFINRTRSKHIITLEDPIEFIHAHGQSIVNQREIGVDTRSFSTGLRAALRQDPDVILVGELRDPETISTAITAAETGHLVISSLHTVDAPQTVDRIIDVFPAEAQQQIRVQLASVLLGVIAQRLLLRADGEGRVAAFEVMVGTPAVANLIRTGKVHQIRSLMQTGKTLGMQTMEASLRELMQSGLITAQEVRRANIIQQELS